MRVDRLVFMYVCVSVLLLFGAFGLGVYVQSRARIETYSRPLPVPVPAVEENNTDVLREALVAMVGQSPRAAFDRLRKELIQDPMLFNECHGIMHEIGHEAFARYGFQEAMRQQDALCGGGYIHGIIEARFGLLQEREILTVLPDLCDSGNTACFHGLGHGLMITTYIDTDLSLSYCDLLPEEGRSDCYDGVWMHIFDLEESGARDIGERTPLTEKEIQEAVTHCQQTDTAYKTNCYFYLPRILAHEEELPFSHYMNLCGRAESAYALTCAAGTGHSSMKYNIATPSKTIASCGEYGSPASVGACKEGAFIYYLFAAGLADTATPEAIGHQSKCDIFESYADRKLCDKVDDYRSQI